MNPTAITLKNFRSIGAELRFEFPESPGLYYMRGINAAQPRLEGNGVGKSSLWDALTWALYAKTARGLGAGDVCTWGEKKGTSVTLEYTDSAGEHTLARTWGPISARLDGEDVSKLPVSSLEYETFLQCVLMAQGQPMFLDLDAPAKSKIFSDVLNLDIWDERAKRAQERGQDIDRELRAAETREASLDSKLRTLQAMNISADRAAWERDRAEKLQELERKHRQLIGQRKERVAASEKAVQAHRDAEARYSHAEDAVRALKPEIERADAELVRHREALVRASQDVANLKEQLEHIAETGVCPTCGQALPDHKHEAASADDIQQRLVAAQGACKPLDARVQKLSATLTQLRANLDALYDRENAAHREREALAREVKALQRDVDILDRDLDRIEDDAQRAEEEPNPFDAMSAQALAQLVDTREELARCQQSIKALRERYALTTLWAKGFKEVRLGLIGDALAELEIEVNSALSALGLVDWEVRFDTDAETKSGGLKRGFSVMVKSPGNDKPVPWKAWSGGESQRLRLAGAMGLADLIRTQRGIDSWLEVWDEPTAWLSPQGVVDLLDCLRERAHRERRQIWVVDHRTLGYGHFDGVATITRTATRTSIQMEH